MRAGDIDLHSTVAGAGCPAAMALWHGATADAGSAMLTAEGRG